jgi:hypothetical protein
MTTVAWAELILLECKLDVETTFDGNKFVHTMCHDKVLISIIVIINEHSSIYYEKKKQLKGSMKQVYCFYPVERGKTPETKRGETFTNKLRQKYH